MARIITLKSEKDFSHSRFKKSITLQNFKIRTAQTSLAYPRFGIIVPKKVMAKVTDRNKTKRRIKSVLAKHQNSLNSADILIFPYKNSLNITLAAMEEELLSAFKRTHLWKS